jgi:hypothetical protein
VLLSLTATHGVHLLDLGVVALGTVLAVAVAARRGRSRRSCASRRRGRPPPDAVRGRLAA